MFVATVPSSEWSYVYIWSYEYLKIRVQRSMRRVFMSSLTASSRFPHNLKQPSYYFISQSVSPTDTSRGVEWEEMDNNESHCVDFLFARVIFFPPPNTLMYRCSEKYRRIASWVEHFVKKMIFTETFVVPGSAIKLSSTRNRQVWLRKYPTFKLPLTPPSASRGIWVNAEL